MWWDKKNAINNKLYKYKTVFYLSVQHLVGTYDLSNSPHLKNLVK